ncbi:MAG: hypothetical protein PUA71_03030 [Eubacteriales bacterium]|nr:hypothetical protein [Eubacteriales bacterium]
MRKSIKKIAATMLAATMVFGTFTTAFAYTVGDVVVKNDDGTEVKNDDGTTKTKKGITDLDEGEYIYLLAGDATGWDTTNPDSVLAKTDREGVVSFKFTIPATENEWEKRFSILGNYCDGDDYVQGGWSRMLLGEPNYKANDAFTCLTSLAVDNLEADTEVTLYYDTRTVTAYIEDADGNAVDYTVGWLTNNRDEKFYTLDELAAMKVDDFKAQLSADRQADLDKIAANTKLTYSLFDGTYKANVEALANYIKTGTDYVKEAEEEPTTEAPTTAAPTTAAPTTAAPTTAAATTAANQATKTGDVAPIALMVVLFAAVATVAVVAKKKEA